MTTWENDDDSNRSSTPYVLKYETQPNMGILKPIVTGFTYDADLHGEGLDGRRHSGCSHISATSTTSVPHTPLAQIPPPIGTYIQDYGSASSLFMTEDEDTPCDGFDWTAAQDKILMQVLDEHKSNPTHTPFSGRYPPSGVVQLAAKNACRLAQSKNLPFPTSLEAIRHRIIYLSGLAEDEQAFALDPQAARHASDFFGSEICNDTDKYDFCEGVASQSQAWRRQASLKGEQQQLENCRIDTQMANRIGGPSLASPFTENACTRQNDDQVVNNNCRSESGFLNIVSRRKRESLRLKRQPQ